jgi:hypothetical protein
VSLAAGCLFCALAMGSAGVETRKSRDEEQLAREQEQEQEQEQDVAALLYDFG